MRLSYICSKNIPEGVLMKYYGRERCEIFAEYMIDSGATVRAAAIHFGISKSTVHKDITTKLRYINPLLYKSVKAV